MQDNVRQDLLRLLPSNVINEICCFAFYDNHPCEEKNIDVTVCCTSGEVKEYYAREPVSSILIQNIKPTDIKLMRNSKNKLYYLVVSVDEIVILSRNCRLKEIHRVSNVDNYSLDDSLLKGQAGLKIIRKDDAVPLIFDDDFENLGDQAFILNEIQAEDSLPLITDLKRKLTEAKYSVKCNEEKLKELSLFRQLAAYSFSQKKNPNSDDALLKFCNKEPEGGLKLKNQQPWCTLCNRKIVIVFNIINGNKDPIENIHILLHTNNRFITYTTKLFEPISNPPFWTEKDKNEVSHKNEIVLVAVIDLKEIRHTVTSKIEFKGVISCNKPGNAFLLPFESVTLSALDVMGEGFDVLAEKKDKIDYSKIALAILATSEKIDLVLRHIMKDGDPDVLLSDLFCNYFHMEKVNDDPNFLIYKKSPYNILYGLMILIHDNTVGNTVFQMSAYPRIPEQVLALIHLINDSVPLHIIITTPKYKMTAKVKEYAYCNEEVSQPAKEIPKTYIRSLLKQTEIILKYLDECMEKMNESKNLVIQNKIGSEIDVLASGVDKFVEFRDKIMIEGCKGVEELHYAREEKTAEPSS